MKIKQYIGYEFKELSEEAKQRAIDKWYEKEDYSFLKSDLEESCLSLLEQFNIKVVDTFKIYYSLCYCQGDGNRKRRLWDFTI